MNLALAAMSNADRRVCDDIVIPVADELPVHELLRPGGSRTIGEQRRTKAE